MEVGKGLVVDLPRWNYNDFKVKSNDYVNISFCRNVFIAIPVFKFIFYV